MPKSLTSIWLRGMKRLMKIEGERIAAIAKQRRKPGGKTGQASAKTAAPHTAAAAGSALRPRVPAIGRSRVGPRAGAWAQGTWTRSFFSAPPAAGELVNHLAYGLYLPSGRRTERLPLVVMLHGCKQTIEEFAQGTRMNLLADQYGFAVLYPEQSKHAHPHRCWRWYDDTPHAGAKEAASIAALVQAVVIEHRLDPTRVYVAGLSAGAGMATLLVMRYARLFAAVALHSGVVFGEASHAVGAMDVMRRGARGDPTQWVIPAIEAGHPGIPAIIIHGDVDGVVAPNNADQLERQLLQLNGALDAQGELARGFRLRTADNATRLRVGGARAVQRDYRAGNRPILSVCRVAGLNHAWSGGDDAFPFHASRGPNASAMIWDFFEVHRRTNPGIEPLDLSRDAAGQPDEVVDA
jgi:poly(hydroxyalkanoate) depolymerase family esterase